ncbi:pyruvate/2-oxoglutarate dehydrogenase complex, dehydrogenase component beta subunit [Mycobacteroides abscessus subsp. abscessus]|nr:pyruvate/2-oxoglutarate dehydrogenase complex, dehydrogenase component beta subunit [Mycobacteroides abscessus subsp. abscessus]
MAEVSAMITESDAFAYLQAPVKRLCGLDTPIPYNPQLEKGTVPQVDDIVREAKQLIQEW